MKIEVLEIKGKDSYLYVDNNYYGRVEIMLNGVAVTDLEIKKGIVFKKTDLLEYMPDSAGISHYARGNEKMSVDEFESMPTYYTDEYDDADVLIRLANKAKLKGFKPVMKAIAPIRIEVVVRGVIEDTGSEFIHSTTNKGKSNSNNCYIVKANSIAISEYLRLKRKYSGSAIFEEVSSEDLKYITVNSKFVFSEKGLSKLNDILTVSLSSAKEHEERIRGKVRSLVMPQIVPNNKVKRVSLISYLESVNKAKDIGVVKSMIGLLLKDLRNLKKEIDL